MVIILCNGTVGVDVGQLGMEYGTVRGSTVGDLLTVVMKGCMGATS